MNINIYIYIYMYIYIYIYICMYAHTTVPAARGPCGPFEVLLHMCPHTAMYICLHTTVYVSSYCYIYVSAGCSLRLGKTLKTKMLSYAIVCRRILTYADVCRRTIYMCPQVPRCALARLLKNKMRIRAVWTRVLRRL
jgi:hypothetical protein